MKRNIFLLFIGFLLIIACSKSNEGGEMNESLDPKIIEEVQYWRLDSIVEWIDNEPVLTVVDQDTSFQYYYFREGWFAARFMFGGFQQVTANYEITNNEITIQDEEGEIYIKVFINHINRNSLQLKEDYTNKEFYADSIIQYFSASNEEKWNWADRTEF